MLALSLLEFIGLIVLVIALVVLIYIILYEYKKWRERIIVKLLISSNT
mgnify:CR=1 FL=1